MRQTNISALFVIKIGCVALQTGAPKFSRRKWISAKAQWSTHAGMFQDVLRKIAQRPRAKAKTEAFPPLSRVSDRRGDNVSRL
jgi:hypothetical protein